MSAVLVRHARCYLTYAQANPDDWGGFSKEWPQLERAWHWLLKQADAPPLLVEFACAFLYQQSKGGGAPCCPSYVIYACCVSGPGFVT